MFPIYIGNNRTLFHIIIAITLFVIAMLNFCRLAYSQQNELPSKTPTAIGVIDFRPNPTVARINEALLSSEEFRIPDVFIIFTRQTIAEFASTVKTTPEQLRLQNPTLTEPLEPGTLVVIPPVIWIEKDQTIAQIATALGISEEMLLAFNTDLGPGSQVAGGRFLRMPTVEFHYPEQSLSATNNGSEEMPEVLLSAKLPKTPEPNEESEGDIVFIPNDSAALPSIDESELEDVPETPISSED